MPPSDDGDPSRKRLVVGVLSALMLVAMVVGTVAFFLSEKAWDEEVSKRNMSKTMRSVELFCAPADYQGTCRETLEGALSHSPPSEHPHTAAAAAITAVERALEQGFNRSTVLDAVRQSNDTLVWEAMHDCRMLLASCRDNVERALSSIAWRGVEGPVQDLQAWLSAVITFQGSCVDMFPKGEVREEVKTTMEKAREISSNALAVIKQGAALASMIDLHAEDLNKTRGGRELEEEPTWVSGEDRKLLAAAAGKAGLTPNLTVAKDGSGDFKNISAALDAMPSNYTGRYFIYVKAGVYEEMVNITNCMANVTMYGDGSKKSIVTGSRNILDGTRMWRTATFGTAGRWRWWSCINCIDRSGSLLLTISLGLQRWTATASRRSAWAFGTRRGWRSSRPWRCASRATRPSSSTAGSRATRTRSSRRPTASSTAAASSPAPSTS
jgi:pectinesterase inhibitor-like protein